MKLVTSDNTRRNNFIDRIGIVLFMGFAFSLPFEMHYSYIALALLAVCTVFNFFTRKDRSIPKKFWLFQLVYWLALLGYFNSSDVFRANYMLERQLTIFLFPLLMPYAIPFNRKNIDLILTSLTLSCIVTLSYLYYCAYTKIKVLQLPIKAIITDPFLNQNFSLPLSLHAGYLSMFIGLSMFFIFDSFKNKQSARLLLLKISTLIFLIAGLLSLAARNPIISIALIIAFIYPLFYIKKKVLYFSIIGTIIICIIYFMHQSAYFENRFSDDFVKEITLNKVKLKDEYQVEPRMQRWICAVELIKKKPIWGYGTGDEVGLLKNAYLQHKLMVSYNLEFNAHNQYLSTILKHGFIGLIIFLSAFLYYLRLGINQHDFVYSSFIILLLIGFSTENILDMNKGIFFFAFFNTLFGYTILGIPEKSKLPKKEA